MLERLLPGRSTTLGSLLEYHNLVRLVEVELSSSSSSTDKENDTSPTQEDKRLLYGIASKVLKQLVQACVAREQEQHGTAHTANITTAAALMEKERKLAIAMQHRFLLQMLATYTPNDGKTSNATTYDEETMQAAKEAAVGAIADPITLFLEQRGILHLHPVQALQWNSGTYNRISKESKGEATLV